MPAPGTILFRYHEDAKAQAAISLLMPVRLDEYRRRELHPIFQMNFPKGCALEQLRNRLAKVANVAPMLRLLMNNPEAGDVIQGTPVALLQARPLPLCPPQLARRSADEEHR